MSAITDQREVLLDVRGLKIFPVRGRNKGQEVVKAVDNVSFHIHKGRRSDSWVSLAAANQQLDAAS